MCGSINKVNVYGVEMTPIQEMKFSQFLQRPKTKAMNTLSKEQRFELVFKWLNNKIIITKK